jgi:hypothetical protein
MATYQIDGSTAVTGTSTRNNRGVIRYAGAIAGTKFVADTLGEPLYGGGVNDSTSAAPSARVAVKLFSAGNFAKMLAEKYIIRRVTTEMAGSTGRTKLLSGGSDMGFRRSIHKIHTVSTVKTASAIRANKFNRYTGDWDTGEPPVVSSDHFANIAGTITATNDDAATPSRTTPGELVYRTGKPDPVQADYEEKTG